LQQQRTTSSFGMLAASQIGAEQSSKLDFGGKAAPPHSAFRAAGKLTQV
jgi:hypothetical protein